MTLLLLDTPESVGRLSRRNPLALLGARHVEVRLPGLPEEEARAWQERMDGRAQACGCTEGAFLMMGGGVAAGAWALLAAAGWAGALLVAAATLAGALLGKLGGLLVARWRLVRLARALRARLGALP